MRTLTSMTTATTVQEVATVPTFRQLLAAEVRAELARQQITGRQLARLVGESPAWAARRLAGGTAMDADDLQRIADAIQVPISQLILEAARRADATRAGIDTGVDTGRYLPAMSGLAAVIPLFSDTDPGNGHVSDGYGTLAQASTSTAVHRREYGDSRTVEQWSGVMKNAHTA